MALFTSRGFAFMLAAVFGITSIACAIVVVLVLSGAFPTQKWRADRNVKDQIVTHQQSAGVFDGINDKIALEEAKGVIGAHQMRLKKLDDDLKAIAPEIREAALSQHLVELEEAKRRDHQAKREALERVLGRPKPKSNP